ncbi:MAG: nucleotidyltransferase family protein [Acidiphilium sp.]
MPLSTAELCAIVTRNETARIILKRLPALKLDQAYLVAGAVFQAVWNHRAQRSPDEGIADYDIAYFDPDLSYDAEDAVIRRADELFADLSARIEIRNQARVHLWYPTRFGAPYPPLNSTVDGISRYLAHLIRGMSGIRWRAWFKSLISCRSMGADANPARTGLCHTHHDRKYPVSVFSAIRAAQESHGCV